MATRGGGVQRSPQFRITDIDAGTELDQDLHHFFQIVNTALSAKKPAKKQLSCLKHWKINGSSVKMTHSSQDHETSHRLDQALRVHSRKNCTADATNGG